ncbi:MAG TPA: hypothetical protein VJ482_08940 [Acidimicrobiia bacterium]|nr:hypothetical protein [Acidimicrobiia bacterium]
MKLLTMEEATEVTAPFHDAYLDAHYVAWERWSKRLTRDPEFTKPLDSSARYKILNCHIVDEIEKRVPNSVRVNGGPGMLMQIIPDRATVRFKHLWGADLRPRYHSTIRQDELVQHAYTEELLGQLQITEPTTPLVCGFTLDPGEHKISRVVIVCHYRDLLLYDIPLLGGGGAEMITFPGLEPTGPTVSSGIAHERTDDSDDSR